MKIAVINKKKQYYFIAIKGYKNINFQVQLTAIPAQRSNISLMNNKGYHENFGDSYTLPQALLL